MVELIPKKEKAIIFPRWVDILFYVAVGVFVIALILFLVLRQFKSAAENDLEDIQDRIKQVRSPERLALEAKLLELEKKIKDTAFLLDSHYEVTKFFTELEKLTHPKVQFTEISLDNLKSTVRLSSLAPDFVAAEQQFRIFNQSDLFKEVELSNLSLSDEGVKFLLSFTFDSKRIYKTISE